MNVAEGMKQRREKRYAHVQNPEPSKGWYAEVKDLVKRVDPKNGEVNWKQGKGSQVGGGAWYVRLGGREALFRFVDGCAFDLLYKDKPAYETSEGYIAHDLREDAIYRLVGLMETHRI